MLRPRQAGSSSPKRETLHFSRHWRETSQHSDAQIILAIGFPRSKGSRILSRWSKSKQRQRGVSGPSCVCHGTGSCLNFCSKCLQRQSLLWTRLFPVHVQRYFRHLATRISWPQSKNEIMCIPKHKHIVKCVQSQIPNPATPHDFTEGEARLLSQWGETRPPNWQLLSFQNKSLFINEYSLW